MANIIEVKGFEKSYGNVKAVQGIDFAVEKGILFAFLGPNGAGKSTTIDTLCTILKCDKGEVYINGYRLGTQDKEIRKNIGVVFQNSVLDGILTIRENLIMRGSFYSLSKADLKKRINEVAEITGIGDILDRQYGKLSGGQKRRADVARALIHKPQILFLDEPTTGLDPKTRKTIWSSIAGIRKELGMTVFLTTHYMEEAASADNIVVIKEGKIVENGTPAYIKNKYTKDHIILYTTNEKVFNYLNSNGYDFVRKNDTVWITMNSMQNALQILNDVSGFIDSFEVIKGDMDDAFLSIIGGEEDINGADD